MNFSPQAKAWILLMTLVLSSGIAIGMTSFLGGASPVVAFIAGLGAAATNVYHALDKSPKDKTP